MNEAIEQVGLNNLLKGITLQTKSKNLEDIYSELYRRGEECKKVRLVMEEALYEYFSNVHLPDSMTIYDQLILSFKEQDYIMSSPLHLRPAQLSLLPNRVHKIKGYPTHLPFQKAIHLYSV